MADTPQTLKELTATRRAADAARVQAQKDADAASKAKDDALQALATATGNDSAASAAEAADMVANVLYDPEDGSGVFAMKVDGVVLDLTPVKASTVPAAGATPPDAPNPPPAPAAP